MKYMLQTTIISVFLLVLASGTCLAQAKTPAASIDPQAEKILQALNAQKKKDMHAELEIIDTMDEVTAAGQKIQYSHVRKLKVSEPRRFWIESTGDITNTTIWKDNATITLLDRAANSYAQTAAPGTIDETMDMMLREYGVHTPLADLLSNSLYDVLMKNVRTCRYVGEHFANGAKCHHLAAVQPDLDWQLWVDTGNAPRIHKIIITYKNKPGAPQYTALLKNFTEVASIPDSIFAFTAPEGAQKIPLLPVAKNSKKK